MVEVLVVTCRGLGGALRHFVDVAEFAQPDLLPDESGLNANASAGTSFLHSLIRKVYFGYPAMPWW